jgi:pyruvate kinase
VCVAADVANLVLDGADGIVLGSETFRGKFPVASVETVLAICRQAEKCFDSFAYYNSVMDYAGYHSLNPDISKVRMLLLSPVPLSPCCGYFIRFVSRCRMMSC